MDKESKYLPITTGCILFIVILSLFISFQTAIQLLLIAIIIELGNISITLEDKKGKQ